MAGNGFAIVISNALTFYVGSENASPTGFDFTLFNSDGTIATNITTDEFWLTGVAFVQW